jgi:hypothetical protein
MMRVISSPSNSTIGFLTLIFAILLLPPRSQERAGKRDRRDIASQNRRQNSIARWNFQRAEIAG